MPFYADLADDRDLPLEGQGEGGGMRYRLAARHRLQEPEVEVDRASDEEVVAMFRACRSARDRLILLLSRVGLRPVQVAGLHRCDLHLLGDSRSLGCDAQGPHLPSAPWTAWRPPEPEGSGRASRTRR